jgi:16S rRNA (cytosine967-C5)-methyltransferase
VSGRRVQPPQQRSGGAARGPAPARRCAFAVLRRVFEQGAYADEALRAEAAGLDTRDHALAMRLSYGAVQRRGTLDHVIEQLAERSPERIDAPLLAALRLGLYELLYTSGAPAYAVVADAVQLAKQGAPAGHGLVNAVLRRAGREGSERLLGGLDDATPEGAALLHSHPQWLARMWFGELGADQARALMAAGNEPSEVALRANPLVPAGERERLAAALPVRSHGDEALPEAVVLEQPFDAHASPLWEQGAFMPQSRAAMLVARSLAPRPGERVLDLCAAPGGKTTHLAALMRGEGEIVAVERDRARAGVLARTAQRMRAGNVRVELADARALPPQLQGFDRVLVDPPCSGLGTLQAHPDLRWRASRAGIEEMAAEQATILAEGARVLRPGGVLVYSTCTISSTENERLIAAFVDRNKDFSVDDLARSAPLAGGLARARTAAGHVLTLPHRDRTAGFFIARLRRA